VDNPLKRYLGHFTIQGRRLPGQVTLAGRDSKLEVFSDHHIHLPKEKMQTIRGVARSGEKVTICNAIGAEMSGSSFYYGTTKHFISLFPHHVAIGPRHIDAERKIVSRISFTTTGAINLFYDHGAFGSSSSKNIRRLMPDWAKKDRRKITYNRIYYYADRGPIVSAKSKDYEIVVFNGGTFSSPSPKGISVKNEVRIALNFKKAVSLEDALHAAHEFRILCEFLSHAKQCIQNVRIQHKNSERQEGEITLHSSYEESGSGQEADFRDNLISGGFHRGEFKQVIERWLAKPTHASARQRVIQNMREEIYTIDRLVGAANAFDILPEFNVAKPLPARATKILSKLKTDAKNLPVPYNEQILNSLGRVKAQTLRKKIEAHFSSLPKPLKQRLPDMLLVIEHCVRARNYFVHGTPPKISVDATHQQIFFLTDTLEFIFVISELAKCGWKYDRWIKEPGWGRYRQYLQSYELSLGAFKELIP
jgi:hypothetical protein